MAESDRLLRQAAADGQVEEIRRLVEQEADVYSRESDGRTALHEAAG